MQKPANGSKWTKDGETYVVQMITNQDNKKWADTVVFFPVKGIGFQSRPIDNFMEFWKPLKNID